MACPRRGRTSRGCRIGRAGAVLSFAPVVAAVHPVGHAGARSGAPDRRSRRLLRAEACAADSHGSGADGGAACAQCGRRVPDRAGAQPGSKARTRRRSTMSSPRGRRRRLVPGYSNWPRRRGSMCRLSPGASNRPLSCFRGGLAPSLLRPLLPCLEILVLTLRPESPAFQRPRR